MRTKRSEKGAALAELALLVPLLLAALVGSIDLGRAGYELIAVANAAQAGAKWGSFSEDRSNNYAGMENAARQDLSKSLPSASFTVAAIRYCTCGDGSEVDCAALPGACDPALGTTRTYVRVRVDKTFNTLVDYPGLPTTIALTREAHMRAR